MKQMMLMVALMAVATGASAQTLKGTVTDEQGRPVAYANVVLEERTDSAFISGAVTGEDGTFALNYTGKTPFQPQRNFLCISSVGYRSAYRDLASADVGTVRLKADATALQGVTVKGSRPLYRMTAGGFVTDVETSVLSKAGTAEDVLKRLPSVTKKKDGFEVFGKGTPLIYINGRKVQDLSELDNLKSEDIRDVELIRNPGAAYDAEVQAVIKIKTKRIKGEGFGFDVRSYYDRSEVTDWIQQVNLNYHHNRWDLFGTFKYNHSEASTYEPLRQLTQTTDTLWQQRNDGHYVFKSDTYTAIAGLSYALNNENSVGARYTATFAPYDINYGTFDNTIITTPGDRPYYDHSLTTQRESQDNRPTHQLNVYYNGKLGKTAIDFNADYMHSQYTSHTDSREESQELDSRTVVSDNAVKNRLVAAKLILTRGGFSLGTEYTFTDRTDSYLSETEQYVPSSDSRLKEQHISPFLEYRRTTPLGSLTAGLRYERVKFDYYNKGVWQSDGSRKYGDWFPSLSWAGQLGKVQLQLSYTTKTARPTYSQLSNNVIYANRFTMQKGNPLLKPSYIHTIELSGMWQFLQFSTSFTDTKNQIIWTATQDTPTSPVTYVSYRNLKDLKAVSANVTAAPKIGLWSPQLYLAIQKQWLTMQTLEGRTHLDNPVFIGMFNNAFTLPKGLLFNVDFTFISRGHTTNVYLYKDRSQLDVSLVKTFFNDKLSVKLEGTDLFRGMLDSNRLFDARTILENYNRYNTRAFSITLRYKFNTGKSHYKGTGAGEEEKSRL